MIRMRGLGLVLAACLGLAAPVSAEVKLPSIFSNSMVLQRDKPIAVWGWDNPGTEVTVSLGESKTAAKAAVKTAVNTPAKTAVKAAVKTPAKTAVKATAAKKEPVVKKLPAASAAATATKAKAATKPKAAAKIKTLDAAKSVTKK
jgi:hypothetical protein